LANLAARLRGNDGDFPSLSLTLNPAS
jgi:hypothetical protein